MDQELSGRHDDFFQGSRPPLPVVVGLEKRRQSLIKSNESVARIFDVIKIDPWSDDEVIQFYKQAFSFRNVKLSDSVLAELVVLFTSGLPMLAHDIGYAVWHVASSETISRDEIIKGIRLAADVIGNKYLKPGILSAIRSERYHSILRKIAATKTQGSQKFEIEKRLTSNEKKALPNFLQRMKKLGALETDSEVRGAYHFPHDLHALYFHLEAQ